jgi:hypothetical protein
LFSFFGGSPPSSSSGKRNSGISQQQKRAVQKANPGRPIRWLNHQDGSQAYASMWRGIVDLQDQVLLNAVAAAADDKHQQKIDDSYSLVLVYPHANSQILHNFCEIFDWARQQQPGILFHLLRPSATIKAQFQPEGPAICLSVGRKEQLPTAPPLQSQQQQQQSETTIMPTTTSMYNNNPDEYTELMNRRTRAWVDRVLVNMGICPFTKSSKTSGQGLAELGVPVGRIAYHASFINSTTSSSINSGRPLISAFDVARLMADTWEAIDAMIKAGPRYQDGGISSILLAAPDFDDHLDIWAGPVFAMLEAGVMAARAEKDVGVVCFHPKYATPDGTTWPGFGHMHSVPRLQKWILQKQEERHEEQREAELEKKRLAMINGGDNTILVEPPSLVLDDDDGLSSKIDDTSSPNNADKDDSNDNYCQVAAGGAWQRRTPHATINVLRADQLEIAEKKRNSAHLYPKNIAKLRAIGNDQLQRDLDRERNMQ